MILMSRGRLHRVAAFASTSASALYILTRLGLSGTILAAKSLVALSEASAHFSKAKKVMASEMAKAGLPSNLIDEITDHYAPSEKELFSLFKSLVKATDSWRR